MAKIDLVGPGYEGRSKNVNASRCVNFYSEVNSQDSKSIVSLIGTPGTSYFANVPDGVIRGMHTFNNLIYLVSGNKLYSVDGNGVRSSQLGNTLQTSIGRVVFSNNGLAPTGGDQIIMSDGVKLYCYNVTSTVFTTIDIESYTNCFIGGYFVSDTGLDGGGRFRVSDLNDGAIWSALEFATAESSPDKLVSVVNNHGELWLFGDYTTEVWYQKGSGSPPFARVSGGVIDFGCAARYSVAQGSNTVIWLGNKRNDNQGQFSGVYMADGYGARLISPQSINYTIDNYSVIRDAFAYFYTDEGHEFYVLTFPTENATWVYDTTTNYWHQRSTYSDDPYKINRHISNCYCHFNNKHYIGDYQSSNILEMRSDVYKDLNDPIVSFRTTNHIFDANDLDNLFISRLQVDVENQEISLSDAESSFQVDEISVGDSPRRIAIVGNYAYVTNYSDDTVSKVNLTNNYIEKTISVGNGPNRLKYAFGYVWVGNFSENTVSKIDPNTDTVISTIVVGNSPIYFESDGDYLWSADYGSDQVSKINPTTDVVEATITVGGTGGSPWYLLYAAGYLWVSNGSSGGGSPNVSKVNTSTNTLESTIVTSGVPYYTTYENGYIWVAANVGLDKINPSTDVVTAFNISTVSGVFSYLVSNDDYIWVGEYNAGSGNDIIHKFDISSETVTTTMTVGDRPFIMTTLGNYVWVACYGSSAVYRLNMDSDIVEKISVGDSPNGTTNDGEYVYVTNAGSDSISKILYDFITGAKISLSWSNDSGNTWSNEHDRILGLTGKYKKRAIWNRLGRSVNKTIRIAITSPIKKVLLGVYLKATKGSN